jgi:signal transduction histidine kinase
MDADPSSAGAASSRDLQNRTAPFIERSPLPMVEVEGQNHEVCFVNAAFCELVKKKRSDVIGKPFAEIVSNGAMCVPLLDRVYQTGEFETHATPDVSTLEPAYWLYAMWPALDEHERPVRVVVQLTKSGSFRLNTVAVNEALLIGGLHQHELREQAETSNARLHVEIAERKRVEQALHEAEARLRAHAHELERKVVQRTDELRASVGELEAFSYSLVHDLRAPVRAIRGFTELALQMPSTEMGPSAVRLLRRVTTAATRMDSLIQDVLSLSQVIRQPITLEPIDVDGLVHTLLEERPEYSPGRATIHVEGPLIRILGHEASLSQCLTNLLDNAVKFVEPGAQPWIKIWSEEFGVQEDGSALTVGAGVGEKTVTPPARWVRLWIEDRGIGIAPEALETVFEMFRQLNSSSRYEGSGIGLAIVRKAIERMSGRVGVESKPGEGSRFWLELPKA